MTDLEKHVNQPGRDKLVKKVREKIKELGITYIYFQFISVTGRVVGKGIPADHWERTAEKGFQLVYGAMIVSFISGMQWQRLIYFKNKLIWLIIPILNFLFTWIFVFYNTFQKYFVINGLVICLLLDLIVRDKILNVNYIRTRIVATILAILSFFVNY